jgi:hypothetical protein
MIYLYSEISQSIDGSIYTTFDSQSSIFNVRFLCSRSDDVVDFTSQFNIPETLFRAEDCRTVRPRIEDRANGVSLYSRSSIFYLRSSILDLLSLLPRYPQVVDARLDEACGAGVRRLDQDSDRLSGELTEVHRAGAPDCVVVLSAAEFLE